MYLFTFSPRAGVFDVIFPFLVANNSRCVQAAIHRSVTAQASYGFKAGVARVFRRKCDVKNQQRRNPSYLLKARERCLFTVRGLKCWRCLAVSSDAIS